MKAIITGSFDPITLGHEDVIARASKLFEHVTVAICLNSSKAGMFTPRQRMELVCAACEKYDNVTPILSEGLLADYCKEQNIPVIVRGLRSSTDFDYEVALSRINRDLMHDLETVFLACDPAYSHISSNVVREMIRYHRSAAPFLSENVCRLMEKMIDKLG